MTKPPRPPRPIPLPDRPAWTREDFGPGWWLDLSKVVVPVGLFAWLGWRGVVAYGVTVLAMVLKDGYRRGLAEAKKTR